MNITKTTINFIQNNPPIKQTLQQGLLNYSSTARLIISQTDLKKKNFDAIIVALRRYHDSLKKNQDHTSNIKKILRQSTLSIETKMVVYVISKGHYWELLEEVQRKAKRRNKTLQVIEGVSEATIIASEVFTDYLDIQLKYKIKKKNLDLALITIRSPETLEEVPGVVAYVFSLLAEHNINIVEMMSCWTDTILVFKKEDLGKVTDLLNF